MSALLINAQAFFAEVRLAAAKGSIQRDAQLDHGSRVRLDPNEIGGAAKV
ncbi:MAG: hypothetical protein U0527_07570 [Candidatus Eisenbacteria bacterium]